MKQHELSLKDKQIFDKYLKLLPHNLSVYNFANIYIWKGIFKISWLVLEGALCVFFKDRIGCFMYLPPLGKIKNEGVLEECLRIMDSVNRNKEISRIENLEEEDLGFYQERDFQIQEKFPEYLCKRSDLAVLAGDKFKSKRASCNYFIKHYQFQYRPLSPGDKKGCLRLYEAWMRKRRSTNKDLIYQGMLKDSKSSLENALFSYRPLRFTGRVVRIGGAVRGFTFGFALNKDTFCILYEITDLSVKGLAQFIFRGFCADLKPYSYINIMDDSGLENLKEVKLSYRPHKLVPAYIAKRKYA